SLAREEFKSLAKDVQYTGSMDAYVKAVRDGVHNTGLAIVRDTYLQGISAIAAPIFDATGQVAAVLTVLGATGSFSLEADGDVASGIRTETGEISRAMGAAAASAQR